MSVSAWRLTHERFKDQALSGNGGLFAPGRWHSQGARIVYSSGNLALATLELYVNLHLKSQLANYVKSKLDFSEALVEDLELATLRAFLAEPDSFDSRSYGDTWLSEQRSCVLKVPSRVVLQEWNYLLNPLHPDFEQIKASTDAYEADERLLTQ